MKEIKTRIDNGTCQTGGRQKSKIFGHSKSVKAGDFGKANLRFACSDFERCGRSIKEMALGLAVVFIILFAAVIFGN